MKPMASSSNRLGGSLKGGPGKGSLGERRPDEISRRPAMSLAKTASGLSLDRNLRLDAGVLSKTLGPGAKGVSAGSSLLNMPKSTLAAARTNRQAVDAVLTQASGGKAKGPLVAPPRGVGVSCSTGTDTDGPEDGVATSSGFDIFGMRAGVIDDGSDDFLDDTDGGIGGGFWVPGASLPTPPRTAEAQQKQAQGPKEFFDGYNLWHEWESRKAGKPFWHCKETGETRWEKPTKSAVQQVLALG